jgi:Uma2 family endonuclease
MQIVEIKTDTVNLTEEQFFLLCARNKELRIERDKHQNLIIMAPTGTSTSNTNGEIFGELRNWNKLNKLGYSFESNAGFTLPNNAIRSPDVSWIAKEKYEILPIEDRERFAHICPDFIIEIKSKSDSLKEQKDKMDEWIENGCRLGWLIDPETKTTHIYKPNSQPTQISFTQILSGEDVLPGFELNLDTIIV